MTATDWRSVTHCCVAGATAWPGRCPWHDTWRAVPFLAPDLPPAPDDDTDQEDQQP